MIERNKTNVALDGIFDEVLRLLSEARRVPLMDKIVIDEDELLNIIDDLKEAIPREIKSAQQVLEEQKVIIDTAKADAERIVQKAKDEAERILSVAQAEADAKVQQEEIVKQAYVVAEEVKSNALRYQNEVKEEADNYNMCVKRDSLQYADDMLVFLENNLQSALQGLAENRENINTALQEVLNPLRNHEVSDDVDLADAEDEDK